MYYEKIINAVLTDSSLYDIYNKVKVKFIDPDFKTLWPWSKFSKDYCRHDILKSYYESSSTLREFFEKTRAAFHPEEFCKFFASGWLEYFIKNEMYKNDKAFYECTKWTINIKDISYPITYKIITKNIKNNVRENKKGGKRKSKKNLKKAKKSSN